MDQVKKHVIKNISEPVGPGPTELLKYMRGPEADYQESEKSEEDRISFIFSIGWFEEFSPIYVEDYDFGAYFSDKSHELRRIDFLKSAMHIHNKAIFDSINEAVDKFRPHGLTGQPYPWKAFVARPIPNETTIEVNNI